MCITVTFVRKINFFHSIFFIQECRLEWGGKRSFRPRIAPPLDGSCFFPWLFWFVPISFYLFFYFFWFSLICSDLFWFVLVFPDYFLISFRFSLIISLFFSDSLWYFPVLFCFPWFSLISSWFLLNVPRICSCSYFDFCFLICFMLSGMNPGKMLVVVRVPSVARNGAAQCHRGQGADLGFRRLVSCTQEDKDAFHLYLNLQV
jgi:hypothetical protein